ncbi:hypothetical protein Rvan_2685 [Rhodomicrobium vannielii ATCC 17100]|uniref:Methyltransferase type 12 n=1 Tax=Rhodomicrobium vannielii (strain ATCC 17100 / DSM 162 / LMG 4299 / NCIMB 10020 / ATH 3.1.1) TaxID=648757 RepID=E3I7H7_RHOVT|nr:hypothetical protein Rvan_2685 [Rhodomicrobium vannielii ATCC 17100]
MQRIGKSPSLTVDTSVQGLKHRLGTFTPDSLLFLAQGILDHSADLLDEGDGRHAFELLERELSEVYDHARRLRCLSRLRLAARSHRIYRHCQDEPFTSYASAKPGGYAVSLDFLNGGLMPLGTPKPAAMIFDHLTASTFALSVRLLKTLTRAYIEDVRTRRARPRILALGAGHLRELEDGPFDLSRVEFTVLEQDEAVCAFLGHKYQKQLTIINASLGEVESSFRDRGSFDLIYAPLMFTLMSDERARRLLGILKNQLAGGGKLIVGNVAATADLRGYLTLFARKGLQFRCRPELKALADGPKFDVYGDPFNNINYLILKNGLKSQP